VFVEPNAADAWFYLGVVYCGRQMIAESIAAHRHAALAQPDNAFYWYALGTMYQTFQPRRWRREASAALREALNRQPVYPEARSALDAIRDASAIRRVLRLGSRVGWFPC
jgi:cytochrome c-type biogenesis protein CcmH/NrfG